jgi:ABC-type nitrate/sulfonate/bicarbonate transport system permease component
MTTKFINLIILIVILVFCWQVVEDKININRTANGETSLEAFVPTPMTILRTFQNDGAKIMKEDFFTLKRALIGFALGIFTALLISILFIFIPSLRNLFYPLFLAINSFPIVGLAPLVILTFGQGSQFSIIFISALICYFPVLISMDVAFRETDKDLLEVLHVLNANKIDTLLKVRLPLAMPYFFLSMKLAIPASIIGATMGEWLGSRNGIGQLVTIALYQLKPGLLYASLITVTITSFILVEIISLIQFFIFPWKRN